ncbi:hypothetical protein M407DRAFT_243308 [Tulasnella calospora MUT 4182]|uniref:Uncharacterized protein n=1 Tax=Tulasnella calospora MUT 4182 TaxID=1051891 RepID=A0A0C3M1D9_9AGAM|nr:hypothetical protein M407DRAFT_243308 [Tulasnella calospora MUT 4182]
MLISLVESISKRIHIARRIHNADIKYQEISLKKLGSQHSSSGKKPDPTQEDDEKLAKVMQGCIAPRLARLRTSYFGPHQWHLVSDWWGVSWLFTLWEGEPGVSIHRHERRIANIEIMLDLVEHRDNLSSEFWNKITQWQLLRYQHDATRIFKTFKREIAGLESVEPSHRACRSALAKAVKRAQAEPPLINATWADAFIIRHLSFDPSLKAVIDSEKWTSSDGRQAVMAMFDELLLDEPRFPLGCDALGFSPLVAD